VNDVWRSKCGNIELRCGRWQDVLADVTKCDAIITDPPYSEQTHAGQRTGSRPLGGGGRKTTITYDGLTDNDIDTTAWFVESTGAAWVCIFSDHQAQPRWEKAIGNEGLYVFAPVLWVRSDPTPRLSGDGPTSSVEYVTVCRPRRRVADSGSRPGHYIGPCDHVGHAGAKPLWLIRRLLMDYSRPGDLVVDPFAGGATTLLACAIEGRRCIGAELDPATYAKAVRRLSAGWTVDWTAKATPMKQGGLL
jgi:site-specific DNA-methyltransferase (adenine-specific)